MNKPRYQGNSWLAQIQEDFSEAEKHAQFYGTAEKNYRLTN
jgi:hypothetical protein